MKDLIRRLQLNNEHDRIVMLSTLKVRQNSVIFKSSVMLKSYDLYYVMKDLVRRLQVNKEHDIIAIISTEKVR